MRKRQIVGWMRKRLQFQRPKVFCFSFQKSGTSSVGEFLNSTGFQVARWDDSHANKWTEYWFEGNYDAILIDSNFHYFNAFEDDPFWCPNFYRYLYSRFPYSKFIPLQRPTDYWWTSMKKHSRKFSLGNSMIHHHIYQREMDFEPDSLQMARGYYPLDSMEGLLSENLKSQYCDVYRRHYREAIQYFNKMNARSHLFVGDLYNPTVWSDLDEFLDVRLSHSTFHHNAS